MVCELRHMCTASTAHVLTCDKSYHRSYDAMLLTKCPGICNVQ